MRKGTIMIGIFHIICGVIGIVMLNGQLYSGFVSIVMGIIILILISWKPKDLKTRNTIKNLYYMHIFAVLVTIVIVIIKINEAD